MRRRCAHNKAEPLRIEGSLKGHGSLGSAGATIDWE